MTDSEPMENLAWMPREIIEWGREAQAIYQAKRLLDFLRKIETPIPGGRMRYVLGKEHLRHLARVHELLDCLVSECAGGFRRSDEAADTALFLAPGEIDRDVYRVCLEDPPFGPVWARFPVDGYAEPKSREDVVGWLHFFATDGWRRGLMGEPDYLTEGEVDRLWRDLIAAAETFGVELERWPAAVEARERLGLGAARA